MPSDPTLLPDRVLQAGRRLDAFLDRTGVTSDRPPRRYLWTDAYAVQSLLGLGALEADPRRNEEALRLVEAVHDVLGRPRPDAPGAGQWLGTDDPVLAHAHPTRGGLRIGKRLPERGPDERFDAQLEWERDGQYFHYLLPWMRALDQAARWLHVPRLNVWARELAVTAHAAFAHGARGRGSRRLYWKMSTDLRRPLVPSMGQHDALDAIVTYASLARSAFELGAPPGPSLEDELLDVADMIEPRALDTDDPLGLGALLLDAHMALELTAHDAFPAPDLVRPILAAALDGVQAYGASRALGLPASRRLPFRELGLSMGLRAMGHTAAHMPRRAEVGSAHLVSTLARLLPVAREIERFWLEPRHQSAPTYTAHLDINEVMLSVSLVAEGVLLRDPPAARRVAEAS